MLGALFYVIIGMFVGWNFPQPSYAKSIQNTVVAKWKEFRGSNKPNTPSE